MKREILFRGKRADDGKWETGDLRHIVGLDGNYYLCIVDNSNGRNNSVTGLRVSSETVGQYTGLTDKNGKKIFEGDIVTMPKCDDIGTVKWDDKAAMFAVEAYANWIDFEIYSGDSFEVVGNIHDTPEMLNRADSPVPEDIPQPVLAPATPENFEIMHG